MHTRSGDTGVQEGFKQGFYGVRLASPDVFGVVKIICLQRIDHLAAVPAEVFFAKDVVKEPVGGAEGFCDGVTQAGGGQVRWGVDND